MKNRNKDGERIVHELRLEEAKNREQLARITKKAQDLEKSVTKL